MPDDPSTTGAADEPARSSTEQSATSPASWTPWELPDLTTQPAQIRHTRHYLGEDAVAPPAAPGERARQQPYRAALVPFIADQSPPLPSATHATVGAAAAAIARFDATLRPIIDPFATVLVQAEASLSARASGHASGAKTVALAALGRSRRQHALAVTGTVAALQTALTLTGPVDEAAVLAMAQDLGRAAGSRVRAGWRTGPLAPSALAPAAGSTATPSAAGGEPAATPTPLAPPVHDQVPELMADLVRFMGRADLPVLVRAAIGHAQFATICPLPSGNGRIGRALIHALLRADGLTEAVTLPISAAVVADPDRYREALEQYRGGQPAAIVDWLGDATLQAADSGRELVASLHAIRASWDDRVPVRAGAATWRLADLLIRWPVVSAGGVARELGIAAPNAHRTIAPLADTGVLTEITGGRRNRLWQATEVTAALDNAALRLTRGRATAR